MINRQMVKQHSASYKIEEINFEAPAFTSKGGTSLLIFLYIYSMSKYLTFIMFQSKWISGSISDIKTLVQEQSNLILQITETVKSQKKIDILEESFTEFKNTLKIFKTVSKYLVKNVTI